MHPNEVLLDRFFQAFQNLDSEVAELVVIFPTNVWEYDVLD